MLQRSTFWRFGLLAIGAGVLHACSGGAGGSSSSGSFSSQGRLLSVTFPDPQGTNGTEEDIPPMGAPLVQQLILEFDANPNPDEVNRLTVQLEDFSGVPARGTFEVDGTRIIFTPDIPLHAPTDVGGGKFDGGGAGLDPGTSYSLRIGPGTWSFVGAVDDALLARFPDASDPAGISLFFTTTSDPARYFKGIEARTPRLVAVDPTNGAIDVTPQLYTDPDGLFAARQPFQMIFDGPLNPALDNLDFLIVDLDDTSVGPTGLSLGVDATILENTLERSVISIQPSGILPFGHTLSLEYPAPLASLSEEIEADRDSVIAATFTTEEAPALVADLLTENFDDTSRLNQDISLLGAGELPAEWDRLDSNVLTAAFAFDGAGELGRFAPAPPAEGEDNEIILDTNLQVFPMLDGSTPDAPPGFEVRGGVFHFTDIDIPKGVTLQIRGVNPVVMTATGNVNIAGKIILKGQSGTPENAFDSAVTSLPGGLGGSGGGRGGEAHPIIHWPPDQVDLFSLVSPQRGGNGYSALNRDRNGGEGGESGNRDKPSDGKYMTNMEMKCGELPADQHDNNDYGAGGSGGSYLTDGSLGRLGAGNVRPDGRGYYVLIRKKDDRANWDKLYPGRPGISPFIDGNQFNDYMGIGGELNQLLGGQGGGAGGSRVDAYYCGIWCKIDTNPANDNVCLGGEFGGLYADSVGDSRGGSAGGGGGGIMIQALGAVTLRRSAVINCKGGNGRGGEVLGNSRWGGPAGGGSGGAIIIQSAEFVWIKDGATLDVFPGTGLARGGDGLIQLQPPVNTQAIVENSNSISPLTSWIDQNNNRNPARFTAFSVGISDWFDMGRTITRGPAGTNPIFEFAGLDDDGFVITDDDGNVIDPELASIRCDYLGQLDPLRSGEYKDGQEPRQNFIPPNATVLVQFQFADAVSPGSKEVDPNTVSDWSSDVSELDTHQFTRYRITFDIAEGGRRLSADAPRPSVQSIAIGTSF